MVTAPNFDTAEHYAARAANDLADALERAGRLVPGVSLDPEFVEAFRRALSGAYRFHRMNGAEDAEALEAANRAGAAFAKAFAFRVATAEPTGAVQ